MEEKAAVKLPYIGANIVMMNVEAASDLDAIDQLAHQLLKEGVVKESYIPAVKKREIEYCTGLLFPDMGIAIPHTDAEHVLTGSIGVAILEHPVSFKTMGTDDIPVDVQIIFMMAIKEAHQQVEFLQRLITSFQMEGRLKDLKASETAKEVASKFQYFLKNNE